jgi:hypothetical protein
MRNRTAIVMSLMCLLALQGCQPEPTVDVHYDQVGACSKIPNPIGSNLAMVVFRLTTADNTKNSADFSLAPELMFVDQDGVHRNYDLFGTYVFDSDFGLTQPNLTYALPAGKVQTFEPFVYFVVVVKTGDPDGAREASRTSYFLRYNKQTSEPNVLLTKNIPKQTEWPYTPQCKDVRFPQ